MKLIADGSTYALNSCHTSLRKAKKIYSLFTSFRSSALSSDEKGKFFFSKLIIFLSESRSDDFLLLRTYARVEFDAMKEPIRSFGIFSHWHCVAASVQ